MLLIIRSPFPEYSCFRQGRKILFSKGYLKDILTRLDLNLDRVSYLRDVQIRSQDPMRKWLIEALHNILQNEQAFREVIMKRTHYSSEACEILLDYIVDFDLKFYIVVMLKTILPSRIWSITFTVPHYSRVFYF